MSIYKYKTQKGEFYGVRFRVAEDGELVHKNLRGFKTQKDAKRAQYEYEHEAELKKPIAHQEASGITFNELFERYMIYARNAVAPSSLYSYNKIAHKYILPVFGERRLSTITRKELSDWQDNIPPNYSYKYKQMLRITMSVIYAYAAEKELVPENLMSKVRGIPNPNADPTWDFWTYEEFQRFIDVVDNDFWRAFFSFLYLSGCRKGEAYALVWSDIDFNSQKVNISKCYSKTAEIAIKKLKATPKTGTKNKKSAKIYMPQSMMDMLKKLPRKHYVFEGENGEPVSDTSVKRFFDMYCERSGVKRIRIHDLRHSCAALIISQCDSELTALYAVAERLRDTPTQILHTYGHLFPSRQRDLNKQLDRLFP